jgi:anthranilate phosphoribosyltransferase
VVGLTVGVTGALDEMTNAAIWPDVLGRLMRGEDLPPEVAERALSVILEGAATDAQIAGFAVALRAKGETTAELAALVRTMLRFADHVEVGGLAPLIDTCGTGGDRSGSVNVSTMAALIAAGAGAYVSKHGNRAQSSSCGSADVLEALGVVIDLGPEGVARCIREAGVGFCFAPRYHPALRFAGAARRELGVPTTFNFLGPLANPAGVKRQAVGVSDPAMAERVVGTLAELGTEHALVFFGHDGLDELTTTTTSTVYELLDGTVECRELDPSMLGIARADHGALAGGDAGGNAQIVHRVLAGQHGPVRDIAVLNAAAALVVAGLADDLAGGIERAGASIDDGKASAALEALVRTSVAAREDGA